jgi:hypothetical protein
MTGTEQSGQAPSEPRSADLPPCCQAWAVEQSRRWTHRRTVTTERDGPAPRSNALASSDTPNATNTP